MGARRRKGGEFAADATRRVGEAGADVVNLVRAVRRTADDTLGQLEQQLQQRRSTRQDENQEYRQAAEITVPVRRSRNRCDNLFLCIWAAATLPRSRPRRFQ